MSCCLNCGSFVVNEVSLCGPCFERLMGWHQKQLEPLNSLKVRALFEWRAGESDLLSKVVLSTKQSGSKVRWSFYANQFVKKWIEEISWVPRNIIIIPAPSRKPAQKDHAYLWAEALADALGAQFRPCLQRTSTSHQRGLDRGERALVEMQLLENSTGSMDFPAHSLWVFVDDVLTTGATAREAHRALGMPPQFEVWVMARRTLPCGASRSLL